MVYNIDKINKINLKIFKSLDKVNLNLSKNFGKINLISIMMIEIQRYLSSTIISIYDKQPKFINKMDFPHVDRNYLIKNIKIDKFSMNSNNNLYKLKYDILSLVKKSNDFEIFNVNAKNHVYEKITKNSFFCFSKQYFQKIYIKNFLEQKEYLTKFLSKFKFQYKIKNKFFVNNFLNYLKIFFSKKEEFKSNSKVLLVGSNMTIENRVMSANYLKLKKKVISFNHANHTPLIYDNPWNEAGEFAFCNNYVDFGKLKFRKKYLVSNYFHPKVINYSTPHVPTEKKVYIKKVNEVILYFSEALHGSRRNGPFRDINDLDYLNFQKKLLIQNKNLLIKRHPKERRYLKKEPLLSLKQKIIYDLKENCESKFKYIIVDRISQKFFESIILKRPVLYLDMNVRNLNSEVKKLLKKNIFIKKINIYKPGKTILDRKLNYKNIYKNYYKILEKCCFNKNKNLNLISNIIKKSNEKN